MAHSESVAKTTDGRIAWHSEENSSAPKDVTMAAEDRSMATRVPCARATAAVSTIRRGSGERSSAYPDTNSQSAPSSQGPERTSFSQPRSPGSEAIDRPSSEISDTAAPVRPVAAPQTSTPWSVRASSTR